MLESYSDCHQFDKTEPPSLGLPYPPSSSAPSDSQLSLYLYLSGFDSSAQSSDTSSEPLDNTLHQHISAFSTIGQRRPALPASPALPPPRNLLPVPYNTRYIADFIISQYERLVDFSYFRANDWQVSKLRISIAKRMQGSDSMRWIMFLGMRTISAVLDGDGPSSLDKHVKLITRFEQQIGPPSEQSLDSGRISNLTGLLELNFLKLKFIRHLNMYQCVQILAPMVCQIIYMDPTLWLDSWNFTAVSLTHILASSRAELIHFILLDSLCSLAYALPQAIEYDTSVAPFDIEMHPTKWIHGCPVEFQHALVEINAHFNARVGARPLRDWRYIEHRLKSWQAKVWSTTDEEPRRTVARLAVQESWRHALLIYLYMGACGVTSDDLRVQASVRQVFKLADTLKGLPLVSIYLPIQYIVDINRYRLERARVPKGTGSLLKNV
ncbi:Fungal specific transcription factor domain [Ceratobasidium sp. AG-Ba]|nr:Fungal specific transcription factor domain [Ceratobasidium sp. AG-Ba]